MRKRTAPENAISARRRAFREHIAAWIFLSAIFVIGDIWQSGKLTWAFYPIVGWGFGLLAHYRKIDRA
jgi:hypothetical protein